MFEKGAVFVEEDSAPDDTNSPQILQQSGSSSNWKNGEITTKLLQLKWKSDEIIEIISL